jgi:outer membrane protein, multidrug efflux system
LRQTAFRVRTRPWPKLRRSLPAVAPDLPSALLERRPDVAEAERQLAARNAQIGVAKAAFFPVVRLTASGGFVSGEFSDLFDWESRVWSINPSVSLPVFQGGRNRANLERARAALRRGRGALSAAGARGLW